MIMVKRLKAHDHEFALNAELIETVEGTPDTVITLTSGKKFIVADTVDEVVRKVIEYRRTVSHPV